MGQKVMVSSTARDLPEHRPMVLDACLRLGFQPIMMEHLAAQDRSAEQVSVGMVDDAELYLIVLAHAYGSCPAGEARSYTEIEFDRAVELGLTVIPFFMHDDHPWKASLVDKGEKYEKLERLREKAAKGRIVQWYVSKEDLRGKAIHALSEFQRAAEQAKEKPRAIEFHPASLITQAPEPYIAHPYTLLHSKDLVGRQRELNLLTDWLTVNRQVPADVRLLHVVALGGMGKSALTWKWLDTLVPQEKPGLAGRLWWSFYESDAHYENFTIRALAYVAGMPEAEARKRPINEREDALFSQLDARPFLLVLDGLERILLAYARMDAAYLPDDELDQQTANALADYADAYGLPEDIKETYLEKHRLRQCADPRAGRFLKRLTRLRASKVLISTRLYPAELQTPTAQPLPGCFALFLKGLGDDDALNLWRAFGVSGSREELLPLFQAFGNYPLLLRALAGEVAEYRPAPGDFDAWREAHPGFNPAAELDLRNAKSHVLHYALRGLGAEALGVLRTLAGFRMPAGWGTVWDLYASVGAGFSPRPDRASKEANGAGTQPRAEARSYGDLDRILTELEDRGLVGWDRRANRYDLHPIVRGVVWAGMSQAGRQAVHRQLHDYFKAAPRPPEWDKVESLEDLSPAIELYHSLIGLERYDEALAVFRDHLEYATLWRLSASRQRAEWLEKLFPEGLGALPRLVSSWDRSRTLNALAAAYHLSGEPGRAGRLFQRSLEIVEAERDERSTAIALCNLSDALRPFGQLRAADTASRRACALGRKSENRFRESVSLQFIGLALAASGQAAPAITALRRSLVICIAQQDPQGEGLVNAYLAQQQLWQDQPQAALPLARRAWELAQVQRLEGDCIRAARLHGEAALGLDDFATAAERLHHALGRARAVNLVEEELPALVALAEWHRRRREFEAAGELLDQVWDAALRGPYPLLHADARLVLARLERDLGRLDAARAAALEAYTLAWCDGPPYAYHFGLTHARPLLQELGVEEPALPPFDESRHEPPPAVELNPEDEFHV